MISQYELDNIRLAAKEGNLEEHLSDLENNIKEQHVCTITWQVDDVAELMEGASNRKIQEVAHKVAKTLEGRSTEEGWQILGDLVNHYNS